jgi:hypothetical protein
VQGRSCRKFSGIGFGEPVNFLALVLVSLAQGTTLGNLLAVAPPIPHMSENSGSTALAEAGAPAAAGKRTVGQDSQMFMAMFETVYLLGLVWSLYQTSSKLH